LITLALNDEAPDTPFTDPKEALEMDWPLVAAKVLGVAMWIWLGVRDSNS
jgi:hypothetical protein